MTTAVAVDLSERVWFGVATPEPGRGRALDLLADLGVQTCRFPLAWARVQPDGRGPLRPAGLDPYRRAAAGLLERGIEPVATLHRCGLPPALEAAGGWTARATALRFAEYAARAGEALGALIDQWITIQEPWEVAFAGLGSPGGWRAALHASHHLLLAHGLAFEALRAFVSGASVGLALNLAPVRPATAADEDRAAALRMDGYLNRWFLDPVLRGAYPEDVRALYERRFGPLDAVRDGDLRAISRPVDFLGVEYDRPVRAAAEPRRPPLGLELVREDRPECLHELLVRLRRDYGDVPIYLTETAAAHDDELARAVADGVDVRRYYACVTR